MQPSTQLPLHLNIFEVLRGEKRKESCCTYPRLPELLMASNGDLQWYFYSKVQATVLRRKKENLGVGKIVQYVTGGDNEHSYGAAPASLLLSFQQAGTIAFGLMGKQRTVQFLRGAPPKRYNLVFLRGMNIERALIRAYWTPNYCICERQEIVSADFPNTDEEYVPTAATKQYVADAALSLSLMLERTLDQQTIKQMNLLFVKDKNFPVPLLIAAYSLKTQCQNDLIKLYNNYRIKMQQPVSEQISSREQKQTINDYPQDQSRNSSGKKLERMSCFQCSTCRDVFDRSQVRHITRNRIHNIQLRSRQKVRVNDIINEVVTDGRLVPNRNRRQFLLNYNEAEICPQCYDKFVAQVREDKSAERNIRSNSRKVIRRANYSIKERSSDVSDNSFMNLGHFKRPRYIYPMNPLSTRSKLVRTRTSVTREEEHDSSTVSHTRGRTIPAHFMQQL